MTTNSRELRQLHHLSQQELANRLGISRYTLIKVEQGKRAFTPPELVQLRDIFQLIDEHPLTPASTLRANIPQKNLTKFREVFLYILQQVGAKPNIGLTVLYKLLYFVDFDHYEKYETQLMGLTYIKNHHGPTPREFVKVIKDMQEHKDIEEVKSKYFQFEQRKYLPLREPNLDLLKPTELQTVDRVLGKLSNMTAKEISHYVHGDIPYQVVEDNQNIDYEYALYRESPYSVRQYDQL